MSAASLVTRGPLAVMVSVALVSTAACGGSSGSKASGGAGSSAPATTSSAATTSAAGGSAAAPTSPAGASSAATSSAAATTSSGASSAGTSSAAPTKVKAVGGGKFCKDVASAINTNALDFSGAGTDVAKERAAIKKGLQETASLLLEAPNEIKPDVTVLVSAINQVYSALEKANYDFTKLDPKLLTVMDTAAVKAAGEHVDAYVKTTCGIDPNA